MTDIDQKLERWSDRFKLRLAHFLITIVGVPLIGLMGTYIGHSIEASVQQMAAKQDEMMKMLIGNDKQLARNGDQLGNHETRIAKLEDRMDVRSDDIPVYTRRPSPDYHKR